MARSNRRAGAEPMNAFDPTDRCGRPKTRAGAGLALGVFLLAAMLFAHRVSWAEEPANPGVEWSYGGLGERPFSRSFPRAEGCRGIRHPVMEWWGLTVDMPHPDLSRDPQEMRLCFNGQPSALAMTSPDIRLAGVYNLADEGVLLFTEPAGPGCGVVYRLAAFHYETNRIFTSAGFGACANGATVEMAESLRSGMEFLEIRFAAFRARPPRNLPVVWRYANGRLTLRRGG